MVVAVADTHAALWHLYDDTKLSATAASFLDQAVLERTQVAVSAITLVEVAYLVEKGRIPATAYDDLTAVLKDPDHIFVEANLNALIVNSLRHIPRSDVPTCPTASSPPLASILVCRSSAAIVGSGLQISLPSGRPGSASSTSRP